MAPHDDDTQRAPFALRYGIPFGAAMLFLGLAVGAAFGGTADWDLAIPTGLVIGGMALATVWLTLRRRGISVTRWLDDYWSRDD